MPVVCSIRWLTSLASNPSRKEYVEAASPFADVVEASNRAAVDVIFLLSLLSLWLYL